MVLIEDVVRICRLLQSSGIDVWLCGGWGIDALLEGETRSHKDLDLMLLVEDVARFDDLLAGEGFRLKEVWPENRWVADGRGRQTATAFVLCDRGGREIDAHALWLDEAGRGIPAWREQELVMSESDLGGEGVVGGTMVRCLSPEAQVALHTGYDLPEVQRLDLERLKGRFRLDTREGILRQRGAAAGSTHEIGRESSG